MRKREKERESERRRAESEGGRGKGLFFLSRGETPRTPRLQAWLAGGGQGPGPVMQKAWVRQAPKLQAHQRKDAIN